MACSFLLRDLAVMERESSFCASKYFAKLSSSSLLAARERFLRCGKVGCWSITAPLLQPVPLFWIGMMMLLQCRHFAAIFLRLVSWIILVVSSVVFSSLVPWNLSSISSQRRKKSECCEEVDHVFLSSLHLNNKLTLSTTEIKGSFLLIWYNCTPFATSIIFSNLDFLSCMHQDSVH